MNFPASHGVFASMHFLYPTDFRVAAALFRLPVPALFRMLQTGLVVLCRVAFVASLTMLAKF